MYMWRGYTQTCRAVATSQLAITYCYRKGVIAVRWCRRDLQRCVKREIITMPKDLRGYDYFLEWRWLRGTLTSIKTMRVVNRVNRWIYSLAEGSLTAIHSIKITGGRIRGELRNFFSTWRIEGINWKVSRSRILC